MTTYAQLGYNYPTENQLLTGLDQSPSAADATGVISNNMTPPNNNSIGAVNSSAFSPLSGNDASLSPPGRSTATTIDGNTTAIGPLTPSTLSQTSKNAKNINNNNNSLNNITGISGLRILHSSTASAIGLSLSLNADVSGGAGADSCDLGNGIDVDADAGAGANVAVGAEHNGTTPCCEDGRPIITDPVSGQTVCSCQYDSARLALSNYSRMPRAAGTTAGVGIYGTPYPSNEQNPYPSIGMDSSAFYSPLSNPYSLKEGSAASDMSAWTSASLQPTTGYYSYDPISAYGYGSSYDLAARRKNATRESTATLKAWLSEHKKNPYPTKGEKIMLAIITKMTLTQVSTWFANARRRLKKENKMTWEPKNKTDDDDEAIMSDEEKDKDDGDDVSKLNGTDGVYGGTAMDELRKDDSIVKSEFLCKDDKSGYSLQDQKYRDMPSLRNMSNGYILPYGQHSPYNPYQQQHPSAYFQQQQQQHQPQNHQGLSPMSYNQPPSGGSQIAAVDDLNGSKNLLGAAECGIPLPASRPKIWSLADTVRCKTPPPPATLPPPPPPSIQMTNAYQQKQEQQQCYQQLSLKQQEHNFHSNNNSSISLSMMSGYASASPYSRVPTAYAVIGNCSSNRNSSNITTNNNNFLNRSPNSSGSGGGLGSASNNTTSPLAAIPPVSQGVPHLTAQQYHQLQQQQPHQHQQRLSLAEIQPDTPPQTPPNMKLPSSSSSGNIAFNQLTRTGFMGTSTSRAAGIYYSTGIADGSPATYARNGVDVGINYSLAAARAEG